MKKAKVYIDQDKLANSSETLRALAHPLRLRLLEFLDENNYVHVNKIYSTLNLEQSITSQHLRILREVGIVNAKREGKFIYYSLNYDKIEQSLLAINYFIDITNDTDNEKKIKRKHVRSSAS